MMSLLLLRAALYGWVALEEPVLLVGDFASDYLPRAKYLAVHKQIATESELALDMYLRPPLFSLVLTPMAWLGLSDVEIGKVARLLNVGVETLCLFGLLWVIAAFKLDRRAGLALGIALLVQPWTAGQLLLPGPDVLMMGILTVWYLGIVHTVWRGPVPGWSLFVVAVALGCSVLLRAEMVVFVWVLVIIWALAESRLNVPTKFRGLRAACFVFAVCLGGAGTMAYSEHVQGRWNLWADGQSEFTDKAATRWVRTWYGNEEEKTNIAWYWYRGKHLSIDFVPESAFRDMSDRAVLGRLLESANSKGALSAGDEAELNAISDRNISWHPFDYYIGIPLNHAVSMWRHSQVQAAWIRFFHAVNWRVPWVVSATLLFLLGFGLLLGLLGSVLSRAWALRFAVLTALALTGARTLLFAAIIPMPESRYVWVCFPIILACSTLGWVWLIGCFADRGGSRRQLV